MIDVFCIAARITMKKASIQTVGLVNPANAYFTSPRPNSTMRMHAAIGGRPNGSTSHMIMTIMATRTMSERIIDVVILLSPFRTMPDQYPTGRHRCSLAAGPPAQPHIAKL